MEYENVLPFSWSTVSVSDVGNSVTGNTPPTKDQSNYGSYLPYIKPPQLDNCLVKSSEEFLSEKGASLARVLPANSVLVSCIGNLGRAALNTVPVAFNQQINAIIPFDGISAKFLFYQVQSHWFRSQLESKATATTISIVNKGNFETVLLNLAPTNEQLRIVSIIEALFSELDKGIESFKTAREQLKIYRQALLKHAFSGKLTEQWRAENADKLESADALLQRIQTERQQRYQQRLKVWEAQSKSPPAPLLQRGEQAANQHSGADPTTVPPFEKGGLGGISKPKAPKTLPPLTAEELAKLPELPEGWAWLRLGEFIDSIEAGKSFKCDEREPNQDEIGVAKVSAVTWGEYDESESKTCIDPSKINPNYFIEKNDFILSRANTIDLVGACVIAKKITKRIMLSDKTLRINFKGINQEYFLQYLRSRLGRKQIMELSTGNQESMRNIGQERIQSIVIPICSPDESDTLVDSLDSGLSQIDQLDQTITTALLQAEALRQSILKKAFSGQLVPQDPNDELAGVFLERIRAENAQADKQTARRRGVKKAKPR